LDIVGGMVVRLVIDSRFDPAVGIGQGERNRESARTCNHTGHQQRSWQKA
jgi:hypothetical protein